MAELFSSELEQDRKRLFSTGQENLPETGYPLFSKTPIPFLTDNVAEQRAAKYHLALGNKSPGYEDIFTTIKSGREDTFRKTLANEDVLRTKQIQLQVLSSMAEQGQLTEENEEFVRTLTFPPDIDPDTYLERQYAKFILQKTMTFDEDSPVPRAVDESLEEVNQLFDAGEHIITIKEGGQKILEEIQGEYEKKGFFGKAYEVAELFVPFRTWINFNDAIEGAPTSALLPGENLRQQMTYIYSLPPERAVKELKVAAREIAKSNVLEAIQFMEYMLAPTRNLRVMENVFAGLDVADVGGIAVGIGAGVARGRRAARAARDVRTSTEQTAEAIRDVVESTGTRSTSAETVMEAAGDVDTAAIKKVLQTIQSDRTKPADVFKNMERQVAGIYNNRILTGTAEGVSNARTSRILQALGQPARDAFRIMFERASVVTVPDEVLPRAFESAKNKVELEYTSMSDAILDIKPAFGRPDILPEDVGRTPQAEIANTLQVEVKLGRTNGELFGNRGSAVSMANNFYRLKPGTYDIKQNGLKFYIRTFKDVDLTDGSIRDKWIGSADTVVPQDLLDSWISYLRTPEDTLSAFDREARHTIVHSTQEMRRLLGSLSANLKSIHEGFGKTKARRVREMFEFSRDSHDPVTGDQGYWFNNILEFETVYRDKFGSLPSEKEVAAYFEGKRINDIDYLMRNVAIYKGKVRQGIQNWSIRFAKPNKETNKLEKRFSDGVEGAIKDDLPWNSPRTFYVAVVDENSGKVTKYNSNQIDEPTKSGLKRLVAQEGYRAIQIANPLDFPLTPNLGLSGEVNFVLAKTMRASPLQLQQIPYRGGGHIKYRGKYWTKQPNLETKRDGRVTYVGDRTLANHATRKEAELFSANINKARNLYNDGDFTELEDYLNSGALPWSVKEFTDMIRRGALSNTSEVTWTEGIDDAATKLRLADQRGTKFDNRYNSPWNMYDQINREYAQERDARLPGIKFEGDEQRPVFKHTKSKLVDPFEVMGQAASRIMDTQYLQDYVGAAAENFIANFSDVLRPSLEELRRNPLKALYEGNFKERGETSEVSLLNAAKQYRAKSLQLLNLEKPFSKQVRATKEKLLDSVFSNLGQPASEWLTQSQLFTATDPFRFVRSVAFNLKLGLFTPVQLILQAQTLNNVIGIAGARIGMQSLPAATFMRWLALNSSEEIVDNLAQRSRNFGWNPDDFKEMHMEMRRSGIYNVEGEVANLDDQFENPGIFRGPVSNFLDKGVTFFREGERIVRLAAYAAAYKEWREVNKFAKMTARSRSQILRRSNDMTNNMTRASNSQWQQGVLTIPTQFFSYQVRLMENIIPALAGKGRLKRKEAARILALNSFLYGVPAGALGTAFGVYPWYEDVRQEALERGMNINEGVIEGFFDGAYSEIIEGLLGTDLDVAGRYAPAGLDIFKEAFITGEASPLELMLGASGSIMGDIYENADPMYRSLKALVDPYSPDEFLAADFINAAAEISTVNQVAKAVYAFNTGKFVTSNGIMLDDATPIEAIITGISGVSLQEVSDIGRYFDSMREGGENFDAHKKEISKYIRFMMQAENQNDPKLAAQFRKRVQILMEMADIRPDQKARIIKDAVDNTNIADEALRNFILNAPPSQRLQRENLMRNNNGTD